MIQTPIIKARNSLVRLDVHQLNRAVTELVHVRFLADAHFHGTARSLCERTLQINGLY